MEKKIKEYNFNTLEQKVDILIRLIASGMVNGKPQNEQIEILSKAGIKPTEIAKIIGTTPNTVRVALSAIRKAKRKKKH